MSFGSGAGSAGKADLEFTTTTGPAKSGIEELRAVYSKATSGMSADALKLQLAQERLDAALIKSQGQVTRSTLAAELNLRALTETSEKVAVSSDVASVALRREATEIERAGRGALAASGLMEHFGRATAFASEAFIGGAGLVFAIRETIKAQEDHQTALGQETAALRAQGLEYTAYKDQIEESLGSLEKLSGFSEDDAVQAFTKLVRTTGDVSKALNFTSLAAKIARGSGIELSTATNIVNKALAGSLVGLKQLGIELPKGATGYQALEIASRKFSGSLQVNADTTAGAQERLSLAVHRTEVGIGEGLTPTVTTLSSRLADWLNKSQSQERIQHDVNQVVKDGTAIIHGLVNAEKLIAPPIHAIVSALGGLENAVEAAFIISLARKAKSGAASIGLIKSASATARTAIVADAAIEEKALAGVAAEAAVAAGVVARVGAYTGGGGKAGVESQAVGGLGLAALLGKGAKKGLSSPAGLLTVLLASQFLPDGKLKSNAQGAATYAAIGSLAGPEGAAIGAGAYEITKGGTALSNYLGSTSIGKSIGLGNSGQLSPSQILKLAQAAHAGQLKQSFLDSIHGAPFHAINDATYAALSNLIRTSYFVPQKNVPGAAPTAHGGLNIPSSISGSSATGLNASGRNALALAQSGRTTSTADDLKALTDERVLLGKKIATETARLKTAVDAKQAGKFAANLEALEGQDASAFSQITSINQAAAQKRSSAAAKVLRDQHAAAAKAAKDYREGVSSTVQGLRDSIAKGIRGETRGIGTRIVGGKVVATNATFEEPTDGQKLRALLKKESSDQKLSKADRDRYRHLYSAELLAEARDEDAFNSKVSSILKKAHAAQAAKLKEQQDVRDAILGNRLTAAQLAEAKAGTNATALKKAQQQELAAELAIIANDRKHEKGLTGAALQAARAQTLQDEIAYQQLKNQNKTPGSGQSAAAFFAQAADERQTYGGNIGQGPLSGQDARGTLGQIATLLRENNRHARSTAAATSTISKSKVTMIDTARRGY